MTTQGAGPPLNPKSILDAERACILHGNVRIEALGTNNEILTKIKPQDRAVYRYLQFTGNEKKVKIRAQSKGAISKIHLMLDSPWNTPIGTMRLDPNDKDEWTTSSTIVKTVKGKHALWLVFDTKNEGALSVDWIRFE